MEASTNIRAVVAATLWRDELELSQVRSKLYRLGDFKDVDKRQDAVNQILAWRLRKHPQPLPLVLESTAVIVDTMIQDDKHTLPSHSLQLLYAGSIMRFVTGFCDIGTAVDRVKISMEYGGRTIGLPVHLVKARHEIVHQNPPGLPDLKRMAQESLDWLWSWYWEKLDQAIFQVPSNTIQQEKDLLQAKQVLKSTLETYRRDRRSEVAPQAKKGSHISHAADVAVRDCIRSYRSMRPKLDLLAELLLVDGMIIPRDHRVGSSTDKAFLLWDPFLRKFIRHQHEFFKVLTGHMMEVMNSPSQLSVHIDPVRDAIYQWLLHMLVSNKWSAVRKRLPQAQLLNDMIRQCFEEPTTWNLKLAGVILKENAAQKDFKTFYADWHPVLEAALSEIPDQSDVFITAHSSGSRLASPEPLHVLESESEMEIDVDSMDDVGCAGSNGWEEWIGMWKRRPIGSLPTGWESDE